MRVLDEEKAIFVIFSAVNYVIYVYVTLLCTMGVKSENCDISLLAIVKFEIVKRKLLLKGNNL
jgi:hypothetical protein